MSFEQDLKCYTLQANADLSASQYCAVKVNSTGKAVIAGVGASNVLAGILQNKPSAAGQSSTVAYDGISKMLTASVIAPGAKVTSDAAGKAVTATTGDNVIGIALNEANTASGDIFPVLLLFNGIA